MVTTIAFALIISIALFAIITVGVIADRIKRADDAKRMTSR